jgi:hypothetical protein
MSEGTVKKCIIYEVKQDEDKNIKIKCKDSNRKYAEYVQYITHGYYHIPEVGQDVFLHINTLDKQLMYATPINAKQDNTLQSGDKKYGLVNSFIHFAKQLINIKTDKLHIQSDSVIVGANEGSAQYLLSTMATFNAQVIIPSGSSAGTYPVLIAIASPGQTKIKSS